MGASAVAAQADNLYSISRKGRRPAQIRPSHCCPTSVWSRSAGPEKVRTATPRQLAAFKRPKATGLVDELPRNAMGKVRKALLRTECSRFLSKS